jgi:hypothetical protein
MLFSRDDFKVEDFGDLLASAPVFVFVAFVGPFVVAAYSLGFVMDVIGWTDAPDNTLGDF